jgi:hypothetical protein
MDASADTLPPPLAEINSATAVVSAASSTPEPLPPFAVIVLAVIGRGRMEVVLEFVDSVVECHEG